MRIPLPTDRPAGRKRLIAGGFLLLIWLAVFRHTLAGLYQLARSDEGHSHLLAVPILVAYFLFADRKRIFAERGPRSGVQDILSVLFLAAGGALFAVPRVLATDLPAVAPPVDFLAASMTSAVLILAGIFLLLAERVNLRGALFPGVLLALLIPIPSGLRQDMVDFLVRGSADFSELFFTLVGTAFYRDQTIFHLPGVTIAVADACSGIRSSIGLFITLLLASHLFLMRWWSKAVLLVTVIPMVLVKNALRIVTLTLLAVHVDTAFLSDSLLHSRGGVVFFALVLVLELPVIIVLRKLERRGPGPVSPKG